MKQGTMQHEEFHASALSRALLFSGVLAGLVFTLAWIFEGANRNGYSWLRHPISSLAIGPSGWMQDVTFLVTGALTLAFAVGLRRVLAPRIGSVWGPLLVAIAGIGFLGAGLFVTDPINGYPPGTPPKHVAYGSTHAALHDLFSALVFLGLPIATFVFTRLFAKWGKAGWAVYSALTGVGMIVMFVVTSAGFGQTKGLVDIAGLLQRITITIILVWMGLLAQHLRKVTKGSAGMP